MTPEDSQGSPTWNRVHDLFHQALELDAAARDALLRRAAEEDPGVAAQVRSLLDSHEKAGGFLDRSPLSFLSGGEAPGDKLGPYRVLEEIGRGGMGVVFRAVREDEHFSKEVAIKLIDPGMRSEGVLKRFRDERQILAMLDHPHIARLIDGGSAPDGSPYLVMEYVAGKPLLQYCDEKRLGIDERLGLFLTVCDAVQFAHQRLVVHRDLKSDNILVTEDGSPRLLDFGIAKLTSREAGDVPVTATAPMQRMLTPDYASPEQVRGELVTVASDVYSLGVVLYELLTGARPLRFETRTPEEILRVVAQEDPKPPSAVIARASETAPLRGETPTRLRRHLAGDLDYITLKALEKDPARRYGSADQLARDIRRYLDKLPVLARGRTTAYLFSRLVRRHRIAVITGTIVALSLLAGLVGTTWQAHVASVQRDRAKRRFDEVRSLAHAVLFDIHDAIANLPGSTMARELLVHHALRYLDSLSKEASGDWGLQHELAVAYGKIGDAQGRPMFPNLGRMPDALRSYQRSMELLDIASKACPESLGIARDLVVTEQRMGDVLGRMGKKDEAMRLELDGKRRILIQMKRFPNDTLLIGDLGVACDRLSDMKAAAGDTLGAMAVGREGVGAVSRRYARNPRNPEARRNLMVGSVKLAKLQERYDPREADANYRIGQDLAEEAVRERPDNTDGMRDLGVVYSWRSLYLADAGVIDSALALHARGMKISEGLAAADPNDVLQQADLANGHMEVGTILMKGRRYREAVDRFGQSYERYARLAAHDTSNAETRTFMARASRRAGEACRALASRSGAREARARWRTKAVDWYGKSLTLYRALGRAGALAGEDAAAPVDVSAVLASLQAPGGAEPDSSR
jgi:non-specific serine/threonine protein kinase/serine/threonine-protein kinase